jgi:hypothetical protein
MPPPDWVLWLKPIISPTRKAEMGRIMVQDQPEQKVSETPSQQNKQGVVV